MYKYLAIALIMISARGWAAALPYRLVAEVDFAKLEQPRVALRVAEKGIGVEYFTVYDLLHGQDYGLVGSVVEKMMLEQKNIGPLQVASSSAEQLDAAVPREQLYREFQERLTAELPNNSLFKHAIDIAPIASSQKIEAAEFSDNLVLAMDVEYLLSIDLRYLHVVATARLFDKSRIPSDIGQKKKSKYKEEDPAVLFRNRYEYFSEKADPAPEKTKASVAAEIDSIRQKYPANLTTFEKSLFRKEALNAGKPLSPSIKAELVIKEWLASDGSMLKAKITEGTNEIVKMAVRDIGAKIATDVKAKQPDGLNAKSPERNVMAWDSGPEILVALLADRANSKVVLEQSHDRALLKYGQPYEGSLGSEPEGFSERLAYGALHSKKYEPQGVRSHLRGK